MRKGQMIVQAAATGQAVFTVSDTQRIFSWKPYRQDKMKCHTHIHTRIPATSDTTAVPLVCVHHEAMAAEFASVLDPALHGSPASTVDRSNR